MEALLNTAFGAAIVALSAYGGHFFTYRTTMDALNQQYRNDKMIRNSEQKRTAYARMLTISEFLMRNHNFDIFTENLTRLEDAEATISLVAPQEIELAALELTNKIVDFFDPELDDQSTQRIRESRTAFLRLAREDLEILG